MAERFARRRVGEVDLDERPLDREQRVAQRDARVGEPAGVHDGDRSRAVEPVDDRTLAVRWKESTSRPSAVACVARPAWISSGFRAVDLGLTRPDRFRFGPWTTRTRMPRRSSAPRRGAAPSGVCQHCVAPDHRARPNGPRRRCRRQDPAQRAAAVLLVGGEWSPARHRGHRVGEAAEIAARARSRCSIRSARSGGVIPRATPVIRLAARNPNATASRCRRSPDTRRRPRAA